MKNIDKRQLVRMAEIASEHRTSYIASEVLKSKGALFDNNNADYLKQEMDFYVEDKSSTLDKKGLETFKEEYKFLEPLSKVAAQLLANSVLDVLSPGDKVTVDNYNKQGLKESVNQKADIKITLDHPNGAKTKKMISLKKYKKLSNPQVASGTWFSTLCGILFEPVGRGKFATINGDTFLSKTSDFENIVKHTCKYYGEECEPHLKNILDVTKEVHKLRHLEQVPTNWGPLIKGLSHKALSDILPLFRIAVRKAPDEIKQRFLRRAGLAVSEEKEILYVAFKKSGKNEKIASLNSMDNDEFNKLLRSLSKDECQLEVKQSGKDFEGQGVQFIFKVGDEILLSASMPLTVNKNGAWANRDRICSKSGKFVKKGERRPKKAMELDTSTNVYLPIKKYAELTLGR